MATVFHALSYCRFIEIQINFRKNFIEPIKASIFLEAVLETEIM